MEDQSVQYTDESIQVLEGLEAVRKRPAMYIGTTDVRGLHHLLYEILDNAVDEALSGYGNEITVQIHTDNSISIQDNGRGMPTGMHDTGKPTPEVIFTVLHAGGKFGQGGYKASGGLHGVGAAVVNALSEWLTVKIVRNGKVYEQSFTNGGKDIGKQTVKPSKEKTGTYIHFKPDATIFSATEFDEETIAERLRESAFLLKDLKITLKDDRSETEETYVYPEGLKSFVEYLNEDKDTLHEVVSFEGKQDGFEVDFSFQFNEG